MALNHSVEVLNQSFSSGTSPIIQRSSSITEELFDFSLAWSIFGIWQHLVRGFVNLQHLKIALTCKRVTNPSDMGIFSQPLLNHILI